jgi:signal transduction histidine kinase
VCIERDVTELRKAQAEIRRLRAEVAHLGRVDLMGHLSAALVHQLRQPIAAILGNAEAGQALLDARTSTTASMGSILQDIAICGRGAAEVIERVARLLRRRAPVTEPLDLNQLARDAAALMHSELILRQVRLVTQLCAERSRIIGDAVQMEQVVLNLLLNGAEAMSDCRISQRVLLLWTTDREQHIELRVCDRGTGVPPEQLEQIFEPFFTTKPDGLGMGLHICAQIVRAHGGRLWAENNDGPGLTMRCLIPAPARSP